MTDAERYQYDARGYLLLEDLIQSSQLEAIDALYDRRLGDAEALRTQAGNDNHVVLEDILNQEIDALRPLVALPGLLPYIDPTVTRKCTLTPRAVLMAMGNRAGTGA